MTDILYKISDINELILKARGDEELYNCMMKLEDNTVNIFDIDNKTSKVDITVPLLWTIVAETSVIPYINSFSKLPEIYNYLINRINIRICNNFLICGRIVETISNIINVSNTYDLYFYENNSYLKFTEMVNDKPEIIDTDLFNIKLHKKVYSSPTEIIINLPQYIERCCFDCKKLNYYGSIMFYLELDKLSNVDKLPKVNYYLKHLNNRITKYGIYHQIVNKIDNGQMMKKIDIDKEGYEILDDEGFTPIERAIIIYSMVNNPLLRKNIRDIIDKLCTFNYRRPPYLFACEMMDESVIKLDYIYDSLILCKNKYDLVISKCRDSDTRNTRDTSNLQSRIFEINTHIIKELIYQRNIDHIVDYIKYIKYNNFNYHILLHGKDLLRILLVKIYTSYNSHNIYDIILKSEFIDILNELNNPKMNDNFIRTLIPKLLENLCFVSLLYLIKKGYNIFEYKYNKPLIHFIADSKLNITALDYEKIIKFINKYSTNNILSCDKNGDTFIHRIALNKPNLLLSIFNISYIMNNIDITIRNKLGDTFLHILVKNKQIDIIRSILNVIKPIINIQNNNNETPLIISARNNDEVLYSLLKKNGADESYRDINGNTVYHYICINEMLIDSTIIETRNKYGFKPSNYTVLHNYWKFVDNDK